MPPIIPPNPPAAQFQAPNIPGLYRPNQILPQSIDQLFDAYTQQKAQDQQLEIGKAQLAAAQMQQANAEAEQRLNFGGMTAGQFNQLAPQVLATPNGPGMVPSQPTPLLPQAQQPFYQQQGQGPAIQPSQPMFGAGAPNPFQQGPQMQPAKESDELATVRHVMAMHQQALQLGAAGQIAGVQKTQAEAQKAGAEASLTGAQAGLLNGSQGVVDHYVNQIKNGNMTVDDLSSLGRGDVANAIKVAVGNQLAQQGVNVNSLNNQQASNKKLAESGAMPAAVTKSIMPSLDILDHLADVADNNSWQTINKYGLKIAAERGDRTANAIITQAGVISEGAQNIYGSGSDSKLAVFQNALNADKTKQQLKDSTRLLKADFSNRIAALKNGQVDNSNPLDLSQQGGGLAANPQAMKIKSDFQAGRITREQARAALGALNVGRP